MALADAVRHLTRRGDIRSTPLHGQIAAVSVGVYRGVAVLDLDYAEDSDAETDMNVVMNSGGGFIEVQGTAEGHAFRREELDALLDLAARGISSAPHGAVRGPAEGLTVSGLRHVVLASSNAGKLREMRAILAGHPVEIVSQSDLRVPPAEEDGETFVANALIKARHAARLTGLPAIADDSGLEVDAMAGRPGVQPRRATPVPTRR